MKDGVIYMAWGENAIEKAKQSIRSLRRFEQSLPVLVVGDEKITGTFDDIEMVNTQVMDVDPFDEEQKKGYKFLAGRVKPLLDGISPFDRTLYVDADTMFVQSPRVGFEKLDLWDVALAETETRCLNDGIAGKDECAATAKVFGTGLLLYHNSGMIFWKKNERTKALFDLWQEEWLKFQGWDEQVALLRALLRSDVLFLTLPYTWNHSEPKKAYLIAHWFGAGDARFDLKQRVREIKAAIGQEGRTTSMVRVKLSGGQFVKCRPGEEEIVRARFMNQSLKKKEGYQMAKKQGPLVKVSKGNGQYVKMYREDAERLGLVFEKEMTATQNKMRMPEGNKGASSSSLVAGSKEKIIPEEQQEDFSMISGIGKATDKKLHEEGIHTFEDLLVADVGFLPGSALKAVEAWRESVTSPEVTA